LLSPLHKAKARTGEASARTNMSGIPKNKARLPTNSQRLFDIHYSSSAHNGKVKKLALD
jgi:hypothetical protein